MMRRTPERKLIIAEADTRVAVVDGRDMHELSGFYDALIKALDFPSYFGQNMDALDEMLHDLSWIPEPGIKLLVLHEEEMLESQPVNREKAWAVFEDVINPRLEIILMSPA